MSIYDDLRGVANSVLADFQHGVVQYVPVVTVPGATPDRPASSVKGTPLTVQTVVRSVSTKYVDGSHVVMSDKQVTIPNDGVVSPQMSGFVRIDNIDHKIIEIMPRPASGDPVVWTVVVRR